ncbi:hypothetical protein OH693_02510 [Escherichia coli]|nr:hypothetical protein [Escherichia sp. MOD1-EC7003]MDF9345926.1 hypothetical protein [Escherichia coli]
MDRNVTDVADANDR